MLLETEQKSFDYEVYTVYKTVNLVNDKFYIGYHKTRDLNDSYLGSGMWLWRSIAKYGRENFIKSTLFIFTTSEEAFAKEIELIALYRGINPLCMNLNCGGTGNEQAYSQDARIKISKALKGRKLSEEVKAKISASGKGLKRSKETCDRISKGKLGKPCSEEHKAKLRGTRTDEQRANISAGRKGKGCNRIWSEESINKLRIANTGYKHSEESLAKMSKSLTGRKHSEETKAKMKESHRLRREANQLSLKSEE